MPHERQAHNAVNHLFLQEIRAVNENSPSLTTSISIAFYIHALGRLRGFPALDATRNFSIASSVA
jgi:hypothetical protein